MNFPAELAAFRARTADPSYAALILLGHARPAPPRCCWAARLMV
jgi:hypothetical protein